jgi:4-aminobutyrate--pyruvate transaminase
LIEREGADTVAAFIGEPVMAAGGALVPPAVTGRKSKRSAENTTFAGGGEVVCGFGRTGNMFGSVTFGIEPDIMVLSKQLSSSYRQLAAVLINDKLYQGVAEPKCCHRHVRTRLHCEWPSRGNGGGA